MTGLMRKSLDTPDETRKFENGMGYMELVRMPGVDIGRATFPPGWRWTEHVRPIAGTETCQAAHTGYVLSGQITVHMNDGTEETFSAGDCMICSPGHDAWTVGDEPCVVLDWQGLGDYAKR